MKHHCNRHSLRQLLGITATSELASPQHSGRTLRDLLGAVRGGEESFKRGCDLREQHRRDA
jgi:hypothetical protein